MIKRYNPDCSMHMTHEIAFMREADGGEYVKYSDHQQLLTENALMLKLLTDISENHVEYFSEGESGMFAGVPLDYVSEINMYISRDVNAENPFPATDAAIAEIEARGAVSAIENLISRKERALAEMHPDTHAYGATQEIVRNQIYDLELFATELREGK